MSSSIIGTTLEESEREQKIEELANDIESLKTPE